MINLEVGLSQSLSDSLLLQNIGPYQLEKPEKVIGGNIGGPRSFEGAGIIAGTGHFPDHLDKSYEVRYLGGAELSSPKVQVTQHAGGESDKWLLHGVDRDFRNYYGLPGDSYAMRIIDNQTIMASGSGGWTYRWLSGNKVVHIEYTDLQLEKPEPLEVVSAYLALHPSSLSPQTSLEIRTDANKTIWIKDEMDRRLWLGGKWMGTITNIGEDRKKKLIRIVDHLNVFLDYREKYYGVGAGTEKGTIDQLLQAEDKDAIEAKLNEYYQWWNQNKTGAINLP